MNIYDSKNPERGFHVGFRVTEGELNDIVNEITLLHSESNVLVYERESTVEFQMKEEKERFIDLFYPTLEKMILMGTDGSPQDVPVLTVDNFNFISGTPWGKLTLENGWEKKAGRSYMSKENFRKNIQDNYNAI